MSDTFVGVGRGRGPVDLEESSEIENNNDDSNHGGGDDDDDFDVDELMELGKGLNGILNDTNHKGPEHHVRFTTSTDASSSNSFQESARDGGGSSSFSFQVPNSSTFMHMMGGGGEPSSRPSNYHTSDEALGKGLDMNEKRQETLATIRDSDAAVKAQAEILKLDTWTHKANKLELRNKNKCHSYRQTWCGTGGNAMSFEWVEHLVYGIIALVVQFLFGHSWAFPDGLDPYGQACGDFRYNDKSMCDEYVSQCGGAFQEDPTYCESWLQSSDPCGGVQPNSAFCNLGETLKWGHGQFKFLTPFILGGYVVSSVGLWRTRRTAYCALCGAVRNMNVNLASILPLPWRGTIRDKDIKQRQLVHARKTLARWSILGFELSVLKARGLVDSEDIALPHLQKLRLIKDGEWDSMVPGDRHTTVWMWLQTMSMQLCNDGVINPHIHGQTICTATTLLRDRANDLMSALDRDQPFPYSSITGILVNSTLLLDALYNGHRWAIMLYQEGFTTIYSQPQMWLELGILVLSSMLFGMLYDLAHILYNPFGARSIDLPHLAVGGGIRKMARSFATGNFLPPTLDMPSANSMMVDVSESERYEEDETEFILRDTMQNLRSRNPRGSIFYGISKRR